MAYNGLRRSDTASQVGRHIANVMRGQRRDRIAAADGIVVDWVIATVESNHGVDLPHEIWFKITLDCQTGLDVRICNEINAVEIATTQFPDIFLTSFHSVFNGHVESGTPAVVLC